MHICGMLGCTSCKANCMRLQYILSPAGKDEKGNLKGRLMILGHDASAQWHETYAHREVA